jgi:hypothetical protein
MVKAKTTAPRVIISQSLWLINGQGCIQGVLAGMWAGRLIQLTLVGLAISPVECLELVGPQSRAGAVEASHQYNALRPNKAA